MVTLEDLKNDLQSILTMTHHIKNSESLTDEQFEMLLMSIILPIKVLRNNIGSGFKEYTERTQDE